MTASATDAGARRAKDVLLFAAVIVAVAAATHATVLLEPLGSDIDSWLYIAGRMAHGEVPYRDHFENKLPPIYEVLRPILATGAPRLALFVSDLLRCLVTAFAVRSIVEAATTSRRVAVAAALTAVAATGIPIFGGTTSTESFASPATAAGIALVLAACRRTSAWPAFAGGTCVAIGAGFRMPTVLCGAALAVPLIDVARRSGVRAGFRLAAWTAVGAAAGFTAVFAPAVVGGYLTELREVSLGWGSRYAAATSAFERSGLSDGSAASGWQFSKLWPLYSLSAVAAATSLHASRRSAVRLCVFAWLVAAVAQARLGGHLFHHHFLPAFVPLCVAASFGVHDLVDVARRRVGAAGAAAAVVCASAAAASILVPIAVPWRRWFQLGDRATTAAGVPETLAYLSSRTAPDEPVLVWTWGWQSELWWRLDRPSPTRHFLAVIYPDVGSTGEQLDEWADQLLRRPPRYVVEGPGAHVSLFDPQDRRHPELESIRRVREAFQRSYDIEAAFGPLTVHRLRERR